MSDLFPCSVTMVSKCPQGSISIPKGSRWKRGWGGREGDLLKRGLLEGGFFERVFLERGLLERGVLEWALLERGL